MILYFQVDQTKGKQNDSDDDEKTEQNIDSKQKKFDKEQDASIQKSEITSTPGGYQDSAQKVDYYFIEIKMFLK